MIISSSLVQFQYPKPFIHNVCFTSPHYHYLAIPLDFLKLDWVLALKLANLISASANAVAHLVSLYVNFQRLPRVPSVKVSLQSFVHFVHFRSVSCRL